MPLCPHSEMHRAQQIASGQQLFVERINGQMKKRGPRGSTITAVFSPTFTGNLAVQSPGKQKDETYRLGLPCPLVQDNHHLLLIRGIWTKGTIFYMTVRHRMG